jgi:hypothetical protein
MYLLILIFLTLIHFAIGQTIQFNPNVEAIPFIIKAHIPSGDYVVKNDHPNLILQYGIDICNENTTDIFFTKTNSWRQQDTILIQRYLTRIPKMDDFCSVVSNTAYSGVCSFQKVLITPKTIQAEKEDSQTVLIRSEKTENVLEVLEDNSVANGWPDTWWINVDDSGMFQWIYSFKGLWYTFSVNEKNEFISIQFSSSNTNTLFSFHYLDTICQ